MRMFATTSLGTCARAGLLAAVLVAPAVVDAATIVEFPVSSPALGITSGPDGNLWFTEGGGSVVGRITPAGQVTEFPQAAGGVGSGSDLFAGITRGSDGNLWFADAEQNRIGRISPGGAAVEYPLPGSTQLPGQIVRGPDGNYWFVESGAGSIGRITPNGVSTHFPVRGQPVGITAAPDGNLWFTENRLSGCGTDFCSTAEAWVGVMTPSGAVKAEYALLGINPLAGRITLGPDGNLWFTQVVLTGPEFDTGGGRLGFVTLDGHIDSIVLPTPNAKPGAITTGPDGAIWFTESATNKIGRRGADGNFNEFTVPTPDAVPNDIVTGPDGNLWFTETAGHAIGKLTPGNPSPFTIGGYVSGNWYNPLQSGQGFEVEVSAQQQISVFWFTYTPDGSGQTWIHAQGTYDPASSTVTLPAEILTGAKFPPNFRSADVHQQGGAPWGSLTLQFDDCDHGYVRWASSVAGYDHANGVPVALTRLTQVAGTVCPGR